MSQPEVGPKRLDSRDPGFAAAFRALLEGLREEGTQVGAAVSSIISDVRTRGDDAVIDYTARFDRQTLTAETLRIPDAEIKAARKLATPETVAALELAAARIRAFHERQMPEDFSYTDAAGVGLGARWTSLGAAGLYVPGGKANYPSSVLMNAIPAKVAGVPRLVMVVPTPDGIVNPLVLVAAEISGVDEVYRIGGAQAVAALAYGTATITPVDKITGPGNAYVAEAKRQVFGVVGIDMIAGPSEILVVSDRDSDPSWIAADLLSQAEHDEAAQSILITDDADFATAVIAAVERHLSVLPREAIARASWTTHGAVILVPDLMDAVPLIDAIAPEHLELAVADPDALAARVRNAGAIFMGRHTPEAIGDYVAGPNHVLPTSRSARFSSGLSVYDFLKRTTMVRCDAQSIREIGPAAVTLAEAEGLGAHALSVALRLQQ
ncbi:histidinol dehydrogenase [Govanella unica]|uniref:Histidinol dehydrogenase n=1 Tax=Govanella unica TaxID=2975056 RepID=A0A9X3TZC7_9PROT|nr:histidinol dehydrogenase [Govania unica]MDA5194515.1 histidinol dehydrogenase [Govania unica]